MVWNGIQWYGMELYAFECNGMELNAFECNGMELNAFEWYGMELSATNASQPKTPLEVTAAECQARGGSHLGGGAGREASAELSDAGGGGGVAGADEHGPADLHGVALWGRCQAGLMGHGERGERVPLLGVLLLAAGLLRAVGLREARGGRGGRRRGGGGRGRGGALARRIPAPVRGLV